MNRNHDKTGCDDTVPSSAGRRGASAAALPLPCRTGVASNPTIAPRPGPPSLGGISVQR